MACGLATQTDVTFTYDSADHYKKAPIKTTELGDTPKARREALDQVWGMLMALADERWTAGCPDACPKRVVVITFIKTDITLDYASGGGLFPPGYWFKVDLHWIVETWCLAADQSLAVTGGGGGGGGGGGSCGLVKRHTGRETSHPWTTCEGAETEAMMLVMERVATIARDVDCPDECPKKLVTYEVGKPDCHDVNWFNKPMKHAGIVYTVEVWCLTAVQGFKVASDPNQPKTEPVAE